MFPRSPDEPNEKIIIFFIEFSGSNMQIESGKNAVSTKCIDLLIECPNFCTECTKFLTKYIDFPIKIYKISY